MIIVLVTHKTLGKVSPKRKIVKISYTMPLDMVYPIYVPIILNIDSFVTNEVVNWYMNLPGA